MPLNKETISDLKPIQGILTGTTFGQSQRGNDGNEELLHTPQTSKIGVSPSDSLVSYPGDS